ncbi:hypothetical protein BJV74DRAFT_989542 [Russula compacta]|nr:hypothetical protein BJV74DRAFT_989542 [Russula compacta]
MPLRLLSTFGKGRAANEDATHNAFTPEQIPCPCGEATQTLEHVLLECPLHAAARRKHLTARDRTRNLPQLFNHPKRVNALLLFLEETGIKKKSGVFFAGGIDAHALEGGGAFLLFNNMPKEENFEFSAAQWNHELGRICGHAKKLQATLLFLALFVGSLGMDLGTTSIMSKFHTWRKDTLRLEVEQI